MCEEGAMSDDFVLVRAGEVDTAKLFAACTTMEGLRDAYKRQTERRRVRLYQPIRMCMDELRENNDSERIEAGVLQLEHNLKNRVSKLWRRVPSFTQTFREVYK